MIEATSTGQQMAWSGCQEAGEVAVISDSAEGRAQGLWSDQINCLVSSVEYLFILVKFSWISLMIKKAWTSSSLVDFNWSVMIHWCVAVGVLQLALWCDAASKYVTSNLLLLKIKCWSLQMNNLKQLEYIQGYTYNNAIFPHMDSGMISWTGVGCS